MILIKGEEFFSRLETRKILGIGDKSLKNLENQGFLKSYQFQKAVNSKKYFKVSDVYKFLEKTFDIK